MSRSARSNPTPAPPLTPPLAEAAAALALGVSRGTLRNWRSQRKGPAYARLGRSIRYDAADLLAWRLRHRVDPEGGR